MAMMTSPRRMRPVLRNFRINLEAERQRERERERENKICHSPDEMMASRAVALARHPFISFFLTTLIDINRQKGRFPKSRD